MSVSADLGYCSGVDSERDVVSAYHLLYVCSFVVFVERGQSIEPMLQ